LFGPIKLSRESNPDGDSQLACYRPWRTRNLRPVAESVLLPGRSEADSPQFLAGAGIAASDIGLVELQLEVQTLIERGDSDEQIRQELDHDGELPEGLLADVITELRDRLPTRCRAGDAENCVPFVRSACTRGAPFVNRKGFRRTQEKRKVANSSLLCVFIKPSMRRGRGFGGGTA